MLSSSSSQQLSFSNLVATKEGQVKNVERRIIDLIATKCNGNEYAYDYLMDEVCKDVANNYKTDDCRFEMYVTKYNDGTTSATYGRDRWFDKNEIVEVRVEELLESMEKGSEWTPPWFHQDWMHSCEIDVPSQHYKLYKQVHNISS